MSRTKSRPCSPVLHQLFIVVGFKAYPSLLHFSASTCATRFDNECMLFGLAHMQIECMRTTFSRSLGLAVSNMHRLLQALSTLAEHPQPCYKVCSTAWTKTLEYDSD